MKKTKSLLAIKTARIKEEEIYNYSKLPYTKIAIFYFWNKEIQCKIPTKIKIIHCENIRDFLKKIELLYKDFSEYVILPYFNWDKNSKYAIKFYNKTFWTKVNPKIFKEKDMMTDFLWEVAEKKFVRHTYKEIMQKEYEELKEKLWNRFIIKPTNASSSVNTFKIKNKEIFENIKIKLAKSYDYIVEEYFWGELYSLDFFFDGEKMFLLVLAREVAMIELSEKEKFSKEFLEKYGEELEKHFNFILPLGYNLDISKLSQVEISFLESVRKKLKEIRYRGIIHLEYKYDKERKKLGFLEWGARYGGYRKTFMKHIYNTDSLRLPYYLLIEKDISRFTKFKGDIYKFKEKEYNLNFIRVKTNFIETKNYIKILKKSWNIFNTSFSWFLSDYYKNKFWISIKKIDFYVQYTKDYNFFPFYKNSNTKLDYILELNDENFSLFKKKKFKIIEEIFFHDYKK